MKNKKYSSQTSFTLVFSKTSIYIALAIGLFSISFMVAANAQSLICNSGGICYISSAITTATTGTTSAIYYPYPYQVSQNQVSQTQVQQKENNHFWVWKWLAMFFNFWKWNFLFYKSF